MGLFGETPKKTSRKAPSIKNYLKISVFQKKRVSSTLFPYFSSPWKGCEDREAYAYGGVFLSFFLLFHLSSFSLIFFAFFAAFSSLPLTLLYP
jgi:hypothetical protein